MSARTSSVNVMIDVEGTTALEVADGGPVPTKLVAVTVKV
jgi:hypothetical protein